jgi:CRISPR-associated protein Csm3
MQLKTINQIAGQIELLTGLHIGAGGEELHIGGIDNAVIKHPHTQEPYIPGSSLKGKMPSLLEWRAGIVGECRGEAVSIKHLGRLEGDKKGQGRAIIQLFGAAGDSNDSEPAAAIGPTRIAFWDCPLEAGWREQVGKNNWLYTETKSENRIDRISGIAKDPRQTERVPAGAGFDFRLTLKILDAGDEALLELLLAGLRLLELDGIGGSGPRGYGKIGFRGLTLNGDDLQSRLQALDPFQQVA